MDAIRLYRDFHIAHWTEGKNVGIGWANIRCPFCDDQSNHLGFHLTQHYYSCWRCGSKPTIKTIAKLLNMPYGQAQQVHRQYGGTRRAVPSQDLKVQIGLRVFQLPTGSVPPSPLHLSYLESRGLNARRVVEEWNLLGTGPVSFLDEADYKHRLIAPIFWNGEIVSFQSRDITDRAELRYKACLKEREAVHHKHILYGKQQEWNEIGICVEGIADVWRLGPTSFAAFGTEVTGRQVRAISEYFRRVVVLFDNEPQAIGQADKLVAELRFRGVDAWRINVEGDPGDLTEEAANHLVTELMKRRS